jgi:hypothetical protein
MRTKKGLFFVATFLMLAFCQCTQKTNIKNYTGSFYYHDSLNHAPQVIPGRLECELYDQGGEGISFHDSDSI